MEETLSDCLIRVREDLSQLKMVRDYLDTNAETEERCSITWRTIEAFNSILAVCSSENSPETNALDTLLDSFYYLARNNLDDSVWDDFGFELGLICVKVLSAIERSDVFEILFCKLLSVISVISEHNSNVWKSTGRQILNVLINKKVSMPYLEAILKLYISILKNIESATLRDFSSQNMHLLKTLSLSIQKLGDFEIQSDVIELIFLHLSKDGKLMSNFFPMEKNLRFTDFENDCRLYLNSLNKPRRGVERKVYSICCHVLYFGGCFVEPPLGRNSIWVDANKDSERVTIKCGNESNGNRIIYIHFSEIITIQLENDKTDGNRCLTIQTKNQRVQNDVSNEDVCLVVENTEEVNTFVQFLKSTIGEKKKRKKLEGKSSKTIDYLLIDRNKTKLEVQDNSITSSEKPNIDNILPEVSSLFERANQINKNSKTSRKTETQIEINSKTGGIVLESQELSPNSFVESLDKHIGLRSPEMRHTFEDSIETIEFFQKSTPGSHKLFRSPGKIFHISEQTNSNYNLFFEEDKENQPVERPASEKRQKIKTKIKNKIKTEPEERENIRVLRNRKTLEAKLSNSQSQDYFQGILQKKKPTLPKLKRYTKSKNSKPNNEKKTKHGVTQQENKSKPEQNKSEKQKESNSTKQSKQKMKNPKQNEVLNKNSKTSPQEQQTKPRQKSPTQTNHKPSLLDPNGYAYQRWCQPTTSERSNFWLKKLTTTEKPNPEADSVFDFSDNSIYGEKKKKRVVRSKPKTKPNQMTLRQAKEIFKTSKPNPKKIQTKNLKHSETSQNKSPIKLTTDISVQPHDRKSITPETLNIEPTADRDSEYESVSEDDEPPPETKKRDRSDSSSTRRYRKKRQKTILPKHITSTIRLRLRKTEEKDRQTTDEIIKTVSKATDHLINHLYRKNGEKIMSYLNIAETTLTVFSGEMDELELRAKRIQRAVLYFKVGCSVADSHETVNNEFSNLRTSLQKLKEMKDTTQVTEQFSDRLSNLLKSGIEELIKGEWECKRSKLLRCASILGIDLTGFDGF